MSVEERLMKIETDVGHLKDDVGGLKATVHELDRKLDDFRVEAAKEFGAVRTSIESAKLWMLISGVGTFVAIIGSAVAIVRTMK
ncbi:MAG TPA: hypothetical protein VGM84_07385 [Steroidobacteraceae bacterium]